VGANLMLGFLPMPALNALTRKNIQFSWNSKCQQAFENLKKKLINPPILQYPDFNKPLY
jgi:hypothetical protein